MRHIKHGEDEPVNPVFHHVILKTLSHNYGEKFVPQ